MGGMALFVYQVVNGFAHITGWEGPMLPQLIIPQTLDGHPVVAIEQWAFGYQNTLEEVRLPEGLETLGWYAFAGCTGLRSLELSSTLREIGGSALKNCTKLNRLMLPSSLKVLGPHFLEGCSALKRLDVMDGHPDYKEINGILYTKDEKELLLAPTAWEGTYRSVPGLKRIAGEAFWGCTRVEGVQLEATVKSVGNHAFYGCPLKNLKLSEGLTDIGEWAFGRGRQLERLTLPIKESLPDGVLAGLRRILEGRTLHFFAGSEGAMERLFDERQKMALLVAYAVGDFHVKSEGATVYEQGLVRYKDGIFRKLLETDGVDGLYTMERLGLIDSGNLHRLLEEASRRRASHCVLYLLEVQHRRYGLEESIKGLDDKWDIDF